MDEAHIPEFTILHQGAAEPHERETHRYPFAGEANPKVRLGVLPLAAAGDAAAVTWFDLTGPFGEDHYLARVTWAEGEGGAPVLWAQVCTDAAMT